MTPVRVSPRSEAPCCQGCQAPLMLHQPDVELPERLLGTCETCKAWHLIDAASGVILLLPDPAHLKTPTGRRA